MALRLLMSLLGRNINGYPNLRNGAAQGSERANEARRSRKVLLPAE